MFVFHVSTIYNRYERPYSVGIIPYLYRPESRTYVCHVTAFYQIANLLSICYDTVSQMK